MRLRHAAARLHALPVAAYPSDVSDDEWAFAAPYLALMREDAPQRKYPLREVFNGLRYIVKTGGQWRWMPHDLPPVAGRCTSRRGGGSRPGVFEATAARPAGAAAPGPGPPRGADRGRLRQPDAAVAPRRAAATRGYDGDKRSAGSKVHAAVDTLGHLLALVATPADAQDRAQVAASVAAVQAATGAAVELA